MQTTDTQVGVGAITLRDLLSKLPDEALDAPLAMHSAGRDRELNTLDTVYRINAVAVSQPDGSTTMIELFSRDERVTIIAGASEYVLSKG
jgi:hypothetical protein